MGSLTSVSMGADLFGGSAAADAYTSATDMFAQIKRYFTPVCYRNNCVVPNATATSGGEWDAYGRNYTYTPTPDVPWKKAWDTLATHSSIPTALKSTITGQFTFKALNQTVCPYDPQFCVPFPGVNFTETVGDYCAPQLSEDVISALGIDAVVALDSQSLNAMNEGATATVGDLVGEVIASMDALVMVCFFSFMIGIVFLALVRLFIGCFIWFILVAIFFIGIFSGGAMYARSGQCSGASLMDSGKTSMVAVSMSATSTVANAVNGVSSSEAMGEAANGYTYRGRQTRTRSGKLCQRWDTQGDPHNFTWTPAAYPNDGLVENYCRNPTNASTIWCMTSDASKRWEICSPIGVLQPACVQGYAVSNETTREALKYVAYGAWILSGLWVLACLILRKRIQLAISLNKVAATFIMQNPTILVVPIGQIIVGLSWIMVWSFCASFLISQVPQSYIPSGEEDAYATYQDTSVCNDKWPQGFPWRDSGNPLDANNTCSGVYGDTSGITPRCWRCGPPRYVLDYKFAYTFFTLLWNNAFLIAFGQCAIAAAVGMWFFTVNAEKGKTAVTKRAAKLVFRSHMGSLALGSFLVAVVQFIRYCLKYLEKQAEAQRNFVLLYILKILQCCMWCFEKCLKFLTKNAYIQVALMGTNFCISAKNAFFIILRNMARFSTMLMLGSIIYYVGLTFILVSTALLGYFVLQSLHPDASPVIPMMVYVMVGYLVGKLYMNVFGLSVDTSLQCFIACEEMECAGDFAPASLVKLLPKAAQKSEAEEDKKAAAKESQVAAA